MKKSQALIVLLCCLSTTIYSLTINSEFHRTEYSETTTLIEKAIANSLTDNSNLIAGTGDLRPKYRIGFDAPQIDHRQILLTIDENTTDGFDWGYDAEIYQIFNDDMYWVIDQKKYVIQATNTVIIGKEIPLGIITAGGAISIGIDALENPIDGIRVCLKDNELNKTYDIQESDYQVTLPAGEYHARYVITFVSTDTNLNDDTTGDDSTGDYSTGDDTTGDDSTGDDSTGDDTTGDDTTGEDTIGDDTTGEDTTGEDTTGDDTTGDDTTGDDTTGDDTTGGDTIGEDTTGDDTTGGDIPPPPGDDATGDDTSDNDTVGDNTENDDSENGDVINEEEIINHQFLMYVNNGSNTINIKNQQLVKLSSFVLYNKLGQVAQIWERNLNDERLSLPINVKGGIYFIQANTEMGRITKRIMISHI